MSDTEVQKRKQIAKRITIPLTQVPGITSLAVIGSVAMGTAGPESDIDVMGTYDSRLDSDALENTFDVIGRDPKMVAISSDPQGLTVALRVDGVSVHVMLGPESYLLGCTERVSQASYEQYDLKFASYGKALVLHDPKGLWPGVKAAIRLAGAALANLRA
jgi:hypothetical protein